MRTAGGINTEGFDLDRALKENRTAITRNMLQWKTELEEFCNFIISHNVQSFL
jgi:hypothetical protein